VKKDEVEEEDCPKEEEVEEKRLTGSHIGGRFPFNVSTARRGWQH